MKSRCPLPDLGLSGPLMVPSSLTIPWDPHFELAPCSELEGPALISPDSHRSDKETCLERGRDSPRVSSWLGLEFRVSFLFPIILRLFLCAVNHPCPLQVSPSSRADPTLLPPTGHSVHVGFGGLPGTLSGQLRSSFTALTG